MKYVHHWNESGKRFVWVKSAEEFPGGVRKANSDQSTVPFAGYQTPTGRLTPHRVNFGNAHFRREPSGMATSGGIPRLAGISRPWYDQEGRA